jgi:hypothetical protein
LKITNGVAYFEKKLFNLSIQVPIEDVKMGLSRFSFLLETSAPGMIPGANVIKLFMGVIYGFS